MTSDPANLRAWPVLHRLGACKRANEWIGARDAHEAWFACDNAHWLLWIIRRLAPDAIDEAVAEFDKAFHAVDVNIVAKCIEAHTSACRRIRLVVYAPDLFDRAARMIADEPIQPARKTTKTKEKH